MEIKSDLNQIRDEINQVDREIVNLLEKRFDLALNIGICKSMNNLPVPDDEREKFVIENCVKMLKDAKYDSYLRKIYIEIINNCKDIQRNEIKMM